MNEEGDDGKEGEREGGGEREEKEREEKETGGIMRRGRCGKCC